MAAAPQEAVAALAFDLETTGRDPYTAEIVQIAIVCANSRKPTPPSFSRLVLPNGPIDPGAQAVHGLSRERLLSEDARPFEEVWAEAEDWIERTFQSTRPLVWCAHNGHRFDRPILMRSVSKHAPPVAGSALGSVLAQPRAVFVDTLPMARLAFPSRSGRGSHTLARLYSDALQGEELHGAHDALADARALATVWRWLVVEQRFDPRSASFQQYLQELAYGLHQPAPPPSQRPAPSRRRSASDKPNAPAVPCESMPRERSLASAARGETSLTSVPGVGEVVSKRFCAMGINSAEELHEIWVARQRNPTKFRGWLIKSMPGVPSIVLSRVVKGLQEHERALDLAP